MKNRQHNKQKMYNAVKTLLNENSGKLNSNKELKDLAGIFDRKYGELSDNETARKNSTKGKTIAKKRCRDEAVIGCISVAAALYSLGKRTHDHELIALSDIEKSTLDRSREMQLLGILERIFDMAQEHISILADFGVGEAELEEYLEIIDRYSRSVGRSQTGVVRRKGAGKKCHSLFNEADDILKRIDKYIRGMTFKDPEFVDHYFDARRIRNLGIRHRKRDENDTGEVARTVV